MERCTLCGGKIRSDGRCSECGLDNTKNDKKYNLNVHNDKAGNLHKGKCEASLNQNRDREKNAAAEASAKEKRNQAAKRQEDWRVPEKDAASQKQHAKKVKERHQTGTVKKKGRRIRLLVMIIIIVELLSVFLPAVVNKLDDLFSGKTRMQNELDAENDREEQVPDTLAVEKPEQISWDSSEEGYYSCSLEPGMYYVGYEIPEGTYQLYCSENAAWLYWQSEDGTDYDYVTLYSADQQKYYEETMEEPCPWAEYSDEIELNAGSFLYVESYDGILQLSGVGEGKGSLQDHPGQTISETVTLSEKMTAGNDFPEGVYDIVFDSAGDSSSFAYLDITDRDDQSMFYFPLAEDYPVCYRIPFADGATVDMQIYGDGAKVSLVPSY